LKNFISTKDEEKIIQAIIEAEKNTSGEIRIHVEEKCSYDLMDRAADVFAELNMHKTVLRNGVLFCIAVKDHQFAVIGDAGINAVVPKDFWNNVRDIIAENFKTKNYVTGLVEGIKQAGHELSAHFPYVKSDIDELSNEISFGSNQ